MKSSTVLMLATPALLVAQAPSYKVTHTYTLVGDGSWDYVVPDPQNHRLFIARQTRVMVVDEDKGTLLGEVTGIRDTVEPPLQWILLPLRPPIFPKAIAGRVNQIVLLPRNVAENLFERAWHDDIVITK